MNKIIAIATLALVSASSASDDFNFEDSFFVRAHDVDCQEKSSDFCSYSPIKSVEILQEGKIRVELTEPYASMTKDSAEPDILSPYWLAGYGDNAEISTIFTIDKNDQLYRIDHRNESGYKLIYFGEDYNGNLVFRLVRESEDFDVTRKILIKTDLLKKMPS